MPSGEQGKTTIALDLEDVLFLLGPRVIYQEWRNQFRRDVTSYVARRGWERFKHRLPRELWKLEMDPDSVPGAQAMELPWVVVLDESACHAWCRQILGDPETALDTRLAERKAKKLSYGRRYYKQCRYWIDGVRCQVEVEHVSRICDAHRRST